MTRIILRFKALHFLFHYFLFKSDQHEHSEQADLALLDRAQHPGGHCPKLRPTTLHDSGKQKNRSHFHFKAILNQHKLLLADIFTMERGESTSFPQLKKTIYHLVE